MAGQDQERYLYTGRRTFFHGGVPGLRVGAWILPPAVTGAPTSKEYADYPPGVYRDDMVYLVTEVEQAKAFAALRTHGAIGHGAKARGGDVYRVVPALLLALDPGCENEGLSWCAPAARIVAIVATRVRRGPYEKQLLDSTRAQQEQERPAKWTRRTFTATPTPAG